MTYHCSISTSLFASAHMLRLQTRTDAKKQVGSSATRIKKEQWSYVCEGGWHRFTCGSIAEDCYH